LDQVFLTGEVGKDKVHYITRGKVEVLKGLSILAEGLSTSGEEEFPRRGSGGTLSLGGLNIDRER